jgi:hypothetical protein
MIKNKTTHILIRRGEEVNLPKYFTIDFFSFFRQSPLKNYNIVIPHIFLGYCEICGNGCRNHDSKFREPKLSSLVRLFSAEKMAK